LAAKFLTLNRKVLKSNCQPCNLDTAYLFLQLSVDIHTVSFYLNIYKLWPSEKPTTCF